MDKSKIESNAIAYEFFLKRNLNKRYRRPSKGELINLINAENGKIYKGQPNAKKQLIEIKSRIGIALNNLLKNENLTKQENDKLLDLIYLNEKAINSNDIIEIILTSIQITKRVSNKK